ncbi:uncharacterized protein CEXT_366631 [Caerostris extrusa]|uniref:Uncharacterized protein n=1 Tax=Caerostris extrusa TaxID=172846 RepID=A0AAV4YFV8_CAEEX|nr:uncharacterized protein CEXT_366631 [Caerostris extrusa]
MSDISPIEKCEKLLPECKCSERYYKYAKVTCQNISDFEACNDILSNGSVYEVNTTIHITLSGNTVLPKGFLSGLVVTELIADDFQIQVLEGAFDGVLNLKKYFCKKKLYEGLQTGCGKILSSGEVCHGDEKSGIVLGFGFRDGLRPREFVEQLVPEVLLAPSEIGGAVQIELHLLGQLIVLGQISQLDDDDAGNAIFQGLSVGRVELQKTPLAFKSAIRPLLQYQLLNSSTIGTHKEDSKAYAFEYRFSVKFLMRHIIVLTICYAVSQSNEVPFSLSQSHTQESRFAVGVPGGPDQGYAV